MSLEALGISAGFIVGCCALAQLARQFARRLVKREGIVPILVNEAIAAAELCACCFELIIVADNFGVASYAIFLFMLTIWWGKVWGDASACPYTHMEDMLEGKTSLREVALCTWAELMGGCCVNPYLGAAIEGIATLLCRLASKSLSVKEPKFSSIIDSFIGTSLVVAAFNFSGGYFNPVLATALKWGCRGHTNIEHIIVYWIGACVGAVISVPVFRLPAVRRFLLGEAKSKKE